jgi:hypothetical protein
MGKKIKARFISDQNVSMDQMECRICYEPTDNTCRPCGHEICRVCLSRWFAQKKTWCPCCTQVIGCPSQYDLPITMNDISFRFLCGTHAGITMRSNDDAVWIHHVERRDLAYRAGLRAGMKILTVNSIPVHNASSVTNILNTIQSYNGLVIVTFRESSAYKMVALVDKCLYKAYNWLQPPRRTLISPQAEH